MSLLTVCRRGLGLSEAEDTRLEQYSFFGKKDEHVVVVAGRLEEGPVRSRVSTFLQMFSAWRRVDLNAWRVAENHGFDGDRHLESLVTMGSYLSSREDRVVL